MKTIKQVYVLPVFVERMPNSLEDGKIYISEMYKVAIHNCLCGCKGKTVTPFSFGEHNGTNNWKLTKNDTKISLEPSILNSGMDCKSHYIITNNIANFV